MNKIGVPLFIVAIIGSIVWVIVTFGNMMDRNSAILGEELHKKKIAIMESNIKWCHDRGGTAMVEIKGYNVTCKIPPRN